MSTVESTYFKFSQTILSEIHLIPLAKIHGVSHACFFEGLFVV